MAAATLQQLAGDRDVFLGIGISSPAVAGQWHGAGYGDRPIAQVREFVALLRECLSGETVSFDGDFYRVSRFRLGLRLGEQQPKIVLAALNEQMLRLAGEIADGVLLNYLPASIVPWCVEQVREGGDAEIYAYVHCGVTDRDRYAELARKDLLNYAVVDAYANQFARAGFADDVEEFRARWKAKERDAALAAIGDAWVDEIQIMGDADHVRAAVQEYGDNGVDQTDRVRAAVGRGPPGDRQHDAGSTRRDFDLATGEARLAGAVLEERRDARGRVLGVEHLDERTGFEVEALGERPSEPVVDRTLREPHRHDRTAAELGGPVPRDVEHFVLRHDPIDDPDRERLVGAHLPPAPDQLLGPGRTDEPGEPLRAPGSGNDAEQDLGLADARVLRRDAEVARHRELETAAQRVAADRGDHRARDRGDRVERLAEPDRDAARRLAVAELVDVGTGCERLVAPGDDDGFHGRVRRQRARRVANGRRASPARAGSSAGG